MRLWTWSDLHTEAQPSVLPPSPPEADAMVCAGDLCNAPEFRDRTRELIERYDMPLVFSPGNHEYFTNLSDGERRRIEADRELMHSVARESLSWRHQVHLVDDSSAIVGGVRFVGGTLWTDFGTESASPADAAWLMHAAATALPDFRRIRHGDGSFIGPQRMLDMHRATRDFIHAELARPFDGPTVVLTHYPPHPACTAPAYGSEGTGDAYGCGAQAFGPILEGESGPELWISGHSHQPFDLEIGRTRMVCNPAGYQADPTERDNGFRKNLVIEV